MYTQSPNYAFAWLFVCILSKRLICSAGVQEDGKSSTPDHVSKKVANYLEFEVYYPQQNAFLELCQPTLLGAQVTKTDRLKVDYFATEMPVPLENEGKDRWVGKMEYDDQQIGKQITATVFAGFVKGGDDCFSMCPLFLESGFPSMLGPKERIVLKTNKTTVTLRPWFCNRVGKSSPMRMESQELGRSFDIDVHFPPSLVENPYVQPTILFAHDGFSAEASPAGIGHLLATLDKTESLGYMKPLIVATVNTTAADRDTGPNYGLEVFTPTRALSEVGCKCPEEWSHWCKSSEIVELSWEKVKTIKDAGGDPGNADKYLDFLYNSLRPKLIKRYKLPKTTQVGNWGYGLAGLLSIYAAASRPSNFHYSFIGSPAMWWNCAENVKSLESAAEKMLENKVKMYFEAGGGEGWGKLEPLPLMFKMLTDKGFKDGKDVWLYMEPAAYMEPIAWTRRTLQGMLAMFGSDESQGLESLARRKSQSMATQPAPAESRRLGMTKWQQPHAPEAHPSILFVEVMYPVDTKVFAICHPQIFGVQASFNMDALAPGLPIPLTMKGKDRWVAEVPYNAYLIGQTATITVVVMSILGNDECFKVCPSFKQSAYPSMLGPKEPIHLKPHRTMLTIRPWFCEREGQSEQLHVVVPQFQTTWLASGKQWGQSEPNPELGVNFGVVIHRPPSLLENPHVNPTVVMAHDGIGLNNGVQKYSKHIESFLAYLDDMQTLGFMSSFLVVLVSSPDETKVLTEGSISQVIEQLRLEGYVNKEARWLYLEPSDERGPLAWTRRAIRGMLALFGTHEANNLVYDGATSVEELFFWIPGQTGVTDRKWKVDRDNVPYSGMWIMSTQAFMMTCLLGCSAVGLVVAFDRKSTFWQVPSEEGSVHARTWSFLGAPSEFQRTVSRSLPVRFDTRSLPIRQPLPQVPEEREELMEAIE